MKVNPRDAAIQLSLAAVRDLGDVERLLQLVDLPIDGLRDQFPEAYVIVRRAGELIAAGGLERYGEVCLLRSIAVAPSARRTGVGRAIVDDRLARARDGGARAVYLLTTTAAAYFVRIGFSPADRDRVPHELALAPEFAGACPASATCLVWRPQPPGPG